AGGAVEDERLGPVGHGLLDPRLEVSTRDVDGAGDAALVPLVALAHVDEERVGAEALVRARPVDLIDLGADVAEDVAVARHYFQNGSEVGVSRNSAWSSKRRGRRSYFPAATLGA